MNSAPSSIGSGRSGVCRVKMRPPRRWRASRRQRRWPARESSRAADNPAAPAPMMMVSKRCGTLGVLLAHDFGPGQLADLEDLLLDLALRGLLSQNTAQVIHLGGPQLVVFRQEAHRGVLKVSF